MKDKDFRELQVSSSQLVVIFLAILILGLIVFLLGVSVGKKQTEIVLQAAGVPPAVKEKSEIIKPDIPVSGEKTGEAAPADSKPAVKVDSTPESKSQEVSLQPKEQAKTSSSKAKPAEASPDSKTKSTAEKPAGKTAASPGQKTPVYYVQVGAFKTREQGQVMAERFKKDGYPVIVTTPGPQDKYSFFRVRIGGYLTRTEAEDTRAKLKQASPRGEDYIIVKIE
jgi:cell division septation protein DedD